MRHEKKFSQQEQAAETHLQSQAHGTIREFASPEEMLRFDARQTQVPPEIAQRLSKSTDAEPVSDRTWWRRFFGGNS